MPRRNCLTALADLRGRQYITPEDVTRAVYLYPIARVRRDLLAVIGGWTEYGFEDHRLCAFIAHRGRP